MKKYNGLMEKISEDLHISRGKQESELSWKARILYSVLGQMAYASLWDEQEDMSPPSIKHFKHRIVSVLTSYLDMYPELKSVFEDASEMLANEIYEIFWQTGNLYHKSYRIAPPKYSCAQVDNIFFARGSSLEEQQCVSGLGTYLLDGNFLDVISLDKMFDLEENTLDIIWKSLIQTEHWKRNSVETTMEYLRMEPPFSLGYWQKQPGSAEKFSIARTSTPDNRIYYLYRHKDNSIEFAEIPRWMTEFKNYRCLTNACLNAYKALPPAKYLDDGNLIHLKIGYLYPPSVLNLIKLYSWPENYCNLPCEFCRSMDATVFNAIRSILDTKGYQFIKE